MDYVSFDKHVNFLPNEKFDEFYKEVSEIVIEAMDKKNRGKEKNVSLQDLMDEYGIVFRNTSAVMKKVTPALTTNLYEPSAIAMKECKSCAVCNICFICSGTNAATITINVAQVVSAIEK